MEFKNRKGDDRPCIFIDVIDVGVLLEEKDIFVKSLILKEKTTLKKQKEK